MSQREDTEVSGGIASVTPNIQDGSTGKMFAESGDAAGRTALVSDEAILALLVELRIMNFMFAQRFGFTDDMAVWRNDPDLSVIP